MVGVEAALEIQVLHRHGKSIREIARETGVARNTVRRYLRDEEAARYKPRPPRSTKLEPFKAYVAERLGSAAPEWIPASVLLMELRERGYCGGYTMLKLFVASLRPQQAVAPMIRFETEPGEQMQVDWAVIRRGSNRLSVFVATLCWSRAAYVEFVTDERVETLIEAHENAFLVFGGTPREVLYDNMRTVVLERHGYGRGRHRFHPGFLDFARHCGFRPRLCAPYRAQTKGKVERPVRYLRGNFVYGRTFLHDADLDHQRALWLDRVANVRLHGTTRERPQVRFDREERFLLQPLASRRYTSLLLDRPSPSTTRRGAPRPVVTVEKRSLTAYAQLTGGAA
jgi:transposase